MLAECLKKEREKKHSITTLSVSKPSVSTSMKLRMYAATSVCSLTMHMQFIFPSYYHCKLFRTRIYNRKVSNHKNDIFQPCNACTFWSIQLNAFTLFGVFQLYMVLQSIQMSALHTVKQHTSSCKIRSNIDNEISLDYNLRNSTKM